MDIRISYFKLHMLPKLTVTGHNNGGTLYVYNDTTLYKIFHDLHYNIEKRERNINFLIDSKVTNGILPKDKIIVNGKFFGYSEDYIKNAKTFRDEIYENSLNFNEKIKIINDIFIALKDVHKLGVYLGDIHLDNMIYKDNQGYLIDYEDIRFSNMDKFRQYYLIRYNNLDMPIITEDKNTDNIKMTISALSFLFNYNFEVIAKNLGIEAVLSKIDKLDINNNCKSDIYFNLSNCDGELEYFNLYLNDFYEQEIVNSKKKILTLL